jgi:hypothetical protein
MKDVVPLSKLKRFLVPDERVMHAEPCQRCGSSLPADHQHVADVERRTLLCVCPACASSLPPNGPETEHRVVPRRYLRVPSAAISDDEWDAFEIPVGIAFFFYNSVLGRTVASYPSPAGAVESVLSSDAWQRVLRASAWARMLAPDVEALLVRRTHDASDCFIVPIDACYELVGRMRRRWSGFGGGPEVREEIESFFTMLREKTEPVIA